MSFFNKKKRFSEVEGYERISRLIEDRQREGSSDSVEGDDLEEETVLLTPAPRAARESSGATAATLSRLPDTRPPESEPAARQEPPGFAPPPPAAAPRIPLPDLTAVSGGASLVSKDAVWDGKLSCTGDVRIEGVLQGEVETTGTLFVAAEARVNGIVRAKNVMLAGEIEGQLRCEQRLEILPGGSARGEIDTGSLVVHEGAYIESKFQMHPGAVAGARA